MCVFFGCGSRIRTYDLRGLPKAEQDIDLILGHISENFNVDLAIETIGNLINFTESTVIPMSS